MGEVTDANTPYWFGRLVGRRVKLLTSVAPLSVADGLEAGTVVACDGDRFLVAYRDGSRGWASPADLVPLAGPREFRFEHDGWEFLP